MGTTVGKADTLYGRFFHLRNSLSVSAQTTVNELHGQATSYVWGWQDAGGDPYDSADATAFGIAYGLYAAMFAAQKIHSRSPIKDAYGWWRKGYRDPAEWR